MLTVRSWPIVLIQNDDGKWPINIDVNPGLRFVGRIPLAIQVTLDADGVWPTTGLGKGCFACGDPDYAAGAADLWGVA
jgi:hypothetical protein